VLKKVSKKEKLVKKKRNENESGKAILFIHLTIGHDDKAL
jgi:hypothetical protein